jgi:hypothetical protein
MDSLYRENRPDISEGNCEPNNETCWTRTIRRVGTFLGITRKRGRSQSSSSQTRKRSRSTSPQINSISKTRKQKKD